MRRRASVFEYAFIKSFGSAPATRRQPSSVKATRVEHGQRQHVSTAGSLALLCGFAARRLRSANHFLRDFSMTLDRLCRYPFSLAFYTQNAVLALPVINEISLWLETSPFRERHCACPLFIGCGASRRSGTTVDWSLDDIEFLHFQVKCTAGYSQYGRSTADIPPVFFQCAVNGFPFPVLQLAARLGSGLRKR